jgi:NAD(P)H dehydrogenase (quinone)
MKKLQLTVFYYSATGANHQMAIWAEEAAKEAGAEVRRRFFSELAPPEAIAQNPTWKSFYDSVASKETEASLEDLEWSDAMIFSIPTRYGNLPGQVSAFFDTTGGLWFQGKLADKVVTGITSSMNPQGGQESTLMSLYKTFTHWGAITIPPGYTDQSIFAAGGNPSGASATVDGEGNIQNEEAVKAAIRHQVKRMVEKAKKLTN